MPGELARRIISLDGEWLYQQDPERKEDAAALAAAPPESWKTMTIPINWYRSEVGDYHGVIWFKRNFQLPDELAEDEITLRFGAVDYLADVWLNGHYLGQHEGFFAPFYYQITNFLKPGMNELLVRVDSPKDETEYRRVPDPPDFVRPLSEAFKTRKPVALTTIKGSCIDFWHRPGWETQFGQDGNTGGIWQSVELMATGSLIIRNIRITPKLVRNDNQLDGTALVITDLSIENTNLHTVEASLALAMQGKNFDAKTEVASAKTLTLTPGLNRVKFVQTVQKPALWWCWDQGEPNLYELHITVSAGDKLQDQATETFGIRELLLDEKGHWWLNGRRVFARGMRYHSSIWLSEGNERLFREDLKKMLALHINAIRIGSHVEKREFYRLCDEMGFLVWQVFPLHWGNYADTDELIERAAPMMRDMVELLYNHPSIVIWSVFKEPNVYPFSPRPNLYGRLCEVMKEAAQQADPSRWVHKGDYGEGAQNVMTGGWGEVNWDFRKVHSNKDPQKVEFGTEHVAPIETAKQILKPEERWPPDWDRWYYLNLDPYWLYLQGIDTSELNGLEELVERSQSWSARQIKESVEYLRQRKWHPNASMFLYFWSDPWPCLGGSGLLDYYRRPYKAYDIFGLVYSPVLVSVEWIKETHVLGHEKRYSPGESLLARLWITNDHHKAYSATKLEWQLVPVGDSVVAHGEKTIDIEPDSSHIVHEIDWPIPTDAHGLWRLEVSLRGTDGAELSSNWFEFRISD